MPVLSGVGYIATVLSQLSGTEHFLAGLPQMTRSSLLFRPLPVVSHYVLGCGQLEIPLWSHKDQLTEEGDISAVITAVYRQTWVVSSPSALNLSCSGLTLLCGDFNLPISQFLHFYIPNCITLGLYANKFAKWVWFLNEISTNLNMDTHSPYGLMMVENIEY